MNVIRDGVKSNATSSDLQRPGNILCRNEDTGVLVYVRPDMLDQESFNLTRIMTPDEIEAEQSNPVKMTIPETEPKIIQTKAGKPFKTEDSARNAMKAQELSEFDYMIMAVDGGFIITKV
jgi:hypothetical protein